jgi:hypothetical protein
LRYIDPTGEYINIEELDASELTSVLSWFNFMYQCSGCVDAVDGYLKLDESMVSDKVLAANWWLSKAINTGAYWGRIRASNNNPKLAFAKNKIKGTTLFDSQGDGHQADLILIDFNDINCLGSDPVSNLALKTYLATMVPHEVAHTYFRDKKGSSLKDPDYQNETGPVVNIINAMTDALGLPHRDSYGSEIRNGLAYQRFTLKSVDSNGNEKTNNLLIHWEIEKTGKQNGGY